MISTDSRIALHCFLKATRFYQVRDHLICIWAVIICATLQDQMVIKSRGLHLEFLCFLAGLWTMHTRGRLRGKPPSPFSQFSLHSPRSHDHREGREAVITFAGCFFRRNNVGFIYACAYIHGLKVEKHCVPREAADIQVTARWYWCEPERWLIGLRFRFALVAHWWL